MAGAADAYMPEKVEFRWPIGDVVTALAHTGMHIELLSERSSPPARNDIPAEVIDRLRRLQNDFTLLARKEVLASG